MSAKRDESEASEAGESEQLFAMWGVREEEGKHSRVSKTYV